jgi:hypothetical protein
MTLPTKGSRAITVDGVRFRWRVRARPTYIQGMAWTPLSFVVQQADGCGAMLIVAMDAAHPSNWVSAPGAVVTPAIVEKAVQEALRSGWAPTRPGPPRHLGIAVG